MKTADLYTGWPAFARQLVLSLQYNTSIAVLQSPKPDFLGRGYIFPFSYQFLVQGSWGRHYLTKSYAENHEMHGIYMGKTCQMLAQLVKSQNANY